MSRNPWKGALALAACALGLVSTEQPLAGRMAPEVLMSPLGNGAGQFASLSGDGRFMAFGSYASTLVPGDANSFELFVFDREDSSVERVSVTSGGAQTLAGIPNGPSISDDGQLIAFHSPGNDLVPGDTNGSFDVFLRDRQAGTTTRISVDSSGNEVVGDSYGPAISGNGQFVAFISRAAALVADDNNNTTDVFVRDLIANTTTRVSVATGGAEASGGIEDFEEIAPSLAISNDGRYVFFSSLKTNLVADDSNGVGDVFRHDRQTGTTIRVSVASGGGQATGASRSPSASGDGRFVAFSSGANNLVGGDTNGVDVFVRDITLDVTTRVSVIGHGGEFSQDSGNPSISGDGRYVAFQSFDDLIVPGDTNLSWDVFIRDRQTATTHRVSVSAAGAQGNGNAHYPSLSDDGAVVGYLSWASNLLAGDSNFTHDVFVADWQALPVPAPPEMIQNGAFAGGVDGSGFPVNWLRFSLPAQADTWWNTTGGTLNFQRPSGSAQNVVFQQTGLGLLPQAAVVAQFDLGNTAPVRKRVSVLVHDNSFIDLFVCTFWLEPNAPMRTYRMRTHTTMRWFNATVSFYAATTGTSGFYQLDNVSMAVDPGGSDWRTDCEDPTAPTPPGGDVSANLLSNGDFSAPTLPPWGTFGSLTWQIAGGVFEFIRPDPPPTPAGVVLQNTGQTMITGEIMTASFELGNSTTLRRRVTVLLHDLDFSDLGACTFWLPPGAPLSTYTVKMATTKPWTNATLSMYAASVGLQQWTRLDNVVFQRTPAAPFLGTECIEPEPPLESSANRVQSRYGSRRSR